MKTSKKNKSIFAYTILFIFLGSLSILGCNRTGETKRELTIGIATWAGFSSAMIGMGKGFFSDLFVKTKIIDDSNARHAAFISGDIDIMISSVDLYAQEAALQIKGKIILVTDLSMGGDGIVALDEIKTVSDLRGKTVAFNRGGPSDYLLYKALADNGVSINEIKQMEVDDPSKAGDAFLGGSVDAAVTWEPFLSQVVKSGKGHILLTTKDYPDIIVDILIANDKITEEKDLIIKFLQGWLKSVDYIKDNPKEAAEIMSKEMHLSIEDVERMMAGLRYADKEINKYFFDSMQPTQTKLATIFSDAGNYWKNVNIITDTAPVADKISLISCEYFQRPHD